MSKAVFDTVAARYAGTALVQKNAAARLIELLAAGPGDDILDLGCGPGSVTVRLKALTKGRIVGSDASEKMIRLAGEMYPDMDFRAERAQDITDEEAFDRIFCNSTFQWFIEDPEGVARNCYRALRSGGRMVVQAPGTSCYCPLFMEGFERAGNDPAYGETARSFQSPWLFLDTAEDYAELFRKAGFSVSLSEIVTTRSSHTLEEAIGNFITGAGAAYLNPAFYTRPLPADWESFLSGSMKDLFREKCEDDKVELVFNRIYLAADKP